MTRKDARTNLNPSLVITFLIVAVTGVMMLFHMGIGGIKHLHEWMSVVFLILGIVHLYLNWNPLRAYLKHGPTTLSLVAVSLLTVLLLFGGNNQHGRGPDGRPESPHAGHLDSDHRK